MRFLTAFILSMLVAYQAVAQQSIGSNTVTIGDGQNSTKTIKFKKQTGATQPGIRYNSSTGLVETSNDGSLWVQPANPAGTVIQFAGSTCPTGYFAADGAALNRTTYASLFTAISTTHGAGDGSTTFNVPDLRGVFVRGAGTRGTAIGGQTYSATLGVAQADQMQSHKHVIQYSNAGAGASTTQFASGTSENQGNFHGEVSAPITEGANGTPRVGTQTHPANVALTFCIKY